MKRNFDPYFYSCPADRRWRRKPARGRAFGSDRDAGFQCGHCRNFVNAEPFISGVKNRNHCPCCLWSKHVDLYKASAVG